MMDGVCDMISPFTLVESLGAVSGVAGLGSPTLEGGCRMSVRLGVGTGRCGGDLEQTVTGHSFSPAPREMAFFPHYWHILRLNGRGIRRASRHRHGLNKMAAEFSSPGYRSAIQWRQRMDVRLTQFSHGGG